VNELLQGIVECNSCNVKHFRLVKPDISKSKIEIRCGGCDKTIGVIEDFMVGEPVVVVQEEEKTDA